MPTILEEAKATLKTARPVLQAMATRLQQARSFGFEVQRVIPSSTVKEPTAGMSEGLLPFPVLLWPAAEFNGWKAAWNDTMLTLGIFGPAKDFPLGPVEEATLKTDRVSELPTIEQAITKIASTLATVSRSLGEAPTRKSDTVMSLVRLAVGLSVVGGALWLVQRRAAKKREAAGLPARRT